MRSPLGASGCTIRFETAKTLSAGDVDAAIGVLRDAFNGGPSWFGLGVEPADHYRWKVESAAGPAVVEMIEDAARLVGVKLTYRRPYLFEGRVAAVDYGADSAIHPSYQGKGISRLLATDSPRIAPLPPATFGIDQQIHPFLVFPNVYRFGNPVDALVKPLSWRRAFTSGQAGEQAEGPSQTQAAVLGGSLAARLRSSWKKLTFGARLGLSVLRRPASSAVLGDFAIRTIDRFDDRAESFWRRASTQFDLIQVRDQAWLNWRYCDPRGGAFTVRAAERDGELLGYAALRVNEREVVLADLLTLPGREDVAASLIADAIGLARERGAPRIRCWMARRHPYRRALEGAGFVRYDLPAPVVFEIRTTPLEELGLLAEPTARVHFMTADTDHV